MAEVPEDYGCNAISLTCNSIALAHGEENEGDIQLRELQAAADSCSEYQHIIEGFRKYKDANDMKKRTRGTNDIVRSYGEIWDCLLYTSPSPRDKRQSRMPSSA